jgi:hypothetical protein
MNTESQTVIAEFAKTLSVPMRKINVRDPNVFQREQGDPARNAESLAFREAIRFECEALQAEIRGNGRYLVLELKAAPNAGSWSINEPDQITLTRAVQNPSVGPAVFASGAILSPKAIEIIHLEAFQSLLKELDMGAGESLNFYKNAVVYYARLGDASKFLERTNAICHFVAGITSPEKAEPRHVDLPEPFADLNECAQEWAISDDTERAEALENASVEVLKKLVERVAPRLSSINEYLNTHSGEKYAALGSLAETVSEAQIVLQQAT